MADTNQPQAIAIVGIGGLFPGAANLDEFWSNIVNRVSAAREVPRERWLLSMEDAFAEDVGTPDRVYSKRACLLDEIPVPPESAGDFSSEFLDSLDPAVRVLLNAGAQAFNDAQVQSLDKSRVGVVIGNLALPSDGSSALAREYLGRSFEERVLGRSRASTDSPSLHRYVAGLPAGILAKALGLGGGAVALDAACASSLYALKQAIDELQSGRADAMLAGGLSRPDSLYTQMGFSQLRALSPTGTCSPFDEKGNGLVVGEGSGMMLLKRVDDAVRDGDHIYAVVRGVGLSNDIGGSLLAPSSEGQLRAMRAAYQQAGWLPHDVDLIECHATGTQLGDATEVGSLRDLWGGEDWETAQCVIGSVKSNIGHLLTAAGAAAMVKVLYAMRHEMLPPTANFDRASSGTGLDDSPFQVLKKTKPWNRRQSNTPRRAAVSAFGFGGINAHVLLEEWMPESAPAIEAPADHPAPAIAVVGMEAQVGPWKGLRAFQERVFGGNANGDTRPPERWWGLEDTAWFRQQGLAPGSFRGHFMDSIEIPLDQFRIPPKELEEMLPQQLLMLKVASGALRDAGVISRDSANGDEDRVSSGVFVGIGLDLNSTNFSFRWAMIEKAREWANQLGLNLTDDELEEWVASLRDAAGPALSANRTMGALGSVVASRIAREYRFGGPGFTISSEESSGMRALESGVRALQSGALDTVLVGAIDMAGDVRAVMATHRDRAFSSNGECRPFDAAADGTVVGEGAVAVVLKRLEDAERDGDRIYAVVQGMGVATGGKVDSSVPDENAYLLAVERAYADAKADPAQVTYIEAHGSGDPREDHMECRALTKLMRSRDGSLGEGHISDPCILGSVKADIGHTGAAAGLAGFVKTCLCLHHEVLPGLNNFDKKRADLAVAGHRLHIDTEAQYWLRDRVEGPRLAGVSAFSVDGNAAHVVLSSYQHDIDHVVQTERLQPLGARAEGLFAVEANNVAALTVGLGRLQAHAEHFSTTQIERVARDWWRGNREDPNKSLAITFVSRSAEELLAQIEYVQHRLNENPDVRLNGKEGSTVPPFVRDRVFFSPEPLARQGTLGFVYPGSGNQYLNMGRDLAVQWPEVLRRQDFENEFLRSQCQPDVFWNEDSVSVISQNHQAALFGQVALGTVTSDLIQSFGVRPGAVIGYSLGETAGLFALKAWTERDLMLKRINQSTLFTEELAGEYRAARKAWQLPNTKTVDWALGVIDRPAKVVRAALQDHKKVYTLIVNTLSECVVGGDVHAVEKLVKKLDCEFFPLHGVTTVHCEVAEEVKDPYRDLHVLETTPPKDVRFYSGCWGTAYNVSKESAADSVLAQAIYGIDYPKLIEAAYDDGVRVFLEMGPGASCSRMIGEILGDRPHVTRSVCHQGQGAVTSVLRALAQMSAERIPVDLSVLYGQETAVVDHLDSKVRKKALRIPIGGEPFEIVMPARRGETPPEAPVESVRPAAIPDAVPHVDEAPSAPEPALAQTSLGDQLAAAALSAPLSAPATTDPLISQWSETEQMKAEAHASYLRFSEATTKALTDALALQMSALQALSASSDHSALSALTVESPPVEPPAAPPVASPPSPVVEESSLAMTREQCMEYAIGSIAKSMGPEFAAIDAHPTRVRLPDEPLMLVDRIIEFQGEPLSLTSGRVVTEHDIHPGAWYLDGGRIPTCIAVEAGQADLILAAYLGIDLQTKGHAVYRLLDAAVTFHRPLPGPGTVIHYDIRIERFFRQGETYLMRFNFDATIDGETFLTMRDGCAGYFTRAELDAGAGIVHTDLDRRPMQGKLPDKWTPPVPMTREAYSDEQINALRAGDLAGCFGPNFAALRLQNPAGLPGGRMKLVDRIVELDPKGGRFGIGIIRGEMDIHPNDWFLTCHFVDDMVMPGTLMYECCLHTLRVYLLRMGWVAEANAVVYEPVQGVAGQLKCRGEVNEQSDKVTYEVTIKEIGFNPPPFVIADTLMYVDGKPSIEMIDMSLQLSGLTREQIERTWQHALPQEAAPREAIFDNASILEFAEGKPSKAFGDRYKMFDDDRVIARLPRPPYKFLDRIVSIEAEQWVMKAGGVIEAEYDVPADEWYFDANRQESMPFAVLLEIALQPCGWLAAYMGSPLTSDVDLHFRNLGGTAVQMAPVGRDVGTLTTRVKSTGVSSSGGMIIQHYRFEMRAGNMPVYQGDTHFGYFSDEALANQIGIRAAAVHRPTEAELSVNSEFEYPRESPYPDDQFRMVDRVDVFDPKGGPSSLGYIRSFIDVDPAAWFFQAHFYQDPVWPGSLGLEAFLQLIKHVAIERWGVGAAPELEAVALGESHTWIYRGQILPTDKRVTVEAVITEIDDDRQALRASGHLTVDGRVIYGMEDFVVRLRER